jgi:hypothetical protein
MRQKSIENQPLRQKPQIRSQDNFKAIFFQLARARSQSSNHRYAKVPRPLLGQTKGMLKKWAAPPLFPAATSRFGRLGDSLCQGAGPKTAPATLVRQNIWR